MKQILVIATITFSFLSAIAKTDFIVPPFIQLGDTIAIISPSGKLSDKTHDIGDQVLAEWGFVPVRSNILPSESFRNKYAGTDEERANDLLWALRNPSVKAIICARGGYGFIHLLDKIPLSIYRKYPKWIVGFSDITTLHCQANLANVMSIHGAMYSSMKKENGQDTTCVMVRDLLLGKTIPSYHITPNYYNHQGKVTGRLIGGNLATLAPLVGTEYDPTICDTDLILFLEEVEENYHAIDRYMNMLKLHGALNRIKGVVVGDFTRCSPNISYNSIYELLDEYFAPLNIPVCYGFPGGHDVVNLPLIEGATMEMKVQEDGVDISFELK